MSKSYITLIRHGKTIANEQRLYCGITDLPLSPGGVAELESRRGVYAPSDIYVSSGLRRTRQTLDILFGAGTAHIVIEGLREISFGVFEMRSYEQLKNVPEYIEFITDDTGERCCPGGESRNGFTERVTRAYETMLDMLRERGAHSCTVITHGGVIAELVGAVSPGMGNFYERQPRPGHGYILAYNSSVFTDINSVSTSVSALL